MHIYFSTWEFFKIFIEDKLSLAGRNHIKLAIESFCCVFSCLCYFSDKVHQTHLVHILSQMQKSTVYPRNPGSFYKKRQLTTLFILSYC